MRMPFQREISDIFESDRSIWIKMITGAGVATFIVWLSMIRVKATDWILAKSIWFAVGLTLGVMVLGASMVLALAFKDVVRRRQEEDLPVSMALVLLFGKGAVSLVLWFVIAFFGGITLIAMTVTG